MTNNDELAQELEQTAVKANEHACFTMAVHTQQILALLAERDADKEQIADLWQRALDVQSDCDASLHTLLPDARYEHPDYGVSVSPLEQVARMVEDYRQRIAELEARELVLIVPPRRCFDYAALAVQERDEQWHKALHDACKRAGIKLEVGE